MHEMSLCEGVLQLIEGSAAENNFSRVKSVWLEIGLFAGVEPEAMRFSFDVVTRGTLADGAKLEIIEVPADVWCFTCEKPVEIRQRFDACPACGGYQIQVSGGDEMRVKELEVE